MKIKPSIIKESVKIRTSLQNRFDELNLRHKEIIADASDHNMRFTISNFCRYMKYGNTKSTLTEEAIVWLCIRYGIEIKLHVGKAEFSDGKVTFTVEPYDKDKCLKNIKKYFGNGK